MARKTSGNREGREDPTDEVVDDDVDGPADVEDDNEAEDLDAYEDDVYDEDEDDDIPTDDKDTAVEARSSATTGQRSLSDRLSTAFLKPTKADRNIDTSRMTEAEKAQAIRRIDSLERKIGYIGAALIALIAAVAFIPYISNPKKLYVVPRTGKTCPTGFKDHVVAGAHQCAGIYPRSHYVVEMAIVLLFAVFIAVATLVGKRSLLAFAFLFSGLAVETTTGTLFGLVFLLAGGWLLIRAYRVQKYGTTSSKEAAQAASDQRRERKAGGASGATSSGRAASSSGKGARSSKSAKADKEAQTTATGRVKPQASKRYTPKAPPRKRPPPAE